MPLTPPKRCMQCTWRSLVTFMKSEDEVMEDKKEATPIMRACDHCDGDGEVQQLCDNCGVALDTANHDANDTDICKTCKGGST